MNEKMNLNSARIKAEQFANCVCIDIDSNYIKCIKRTDLNGRQLISGDSYINDLVNELTHAYMNGDDTLNIEQELTKTITDFIVDYWTQEEEEMTC